MWRNNSAEERRRIRELGITFGSLPVGEYNALTDVDGVLVGHTTLVKGGRVRTGVTAVLPCRDFWQRQVCGAACTIHGNGQLTGGEWLNTKGFLESPVMLTNTLSVGEVYGGVIRHMVRTFPSDPNILPVVSECYDGYVNDIKALAITPAHAEQAICAAQSGAIAEGAVGAGTGMRAYDFKGGIGTSSRVLKDFGYTVGVLANTNGGRRHELLLQGKKIAELTADVPLPDADRDGSFVFVVATDAPMSHLQLRQLAQRTTHGLARTGSISAFGSGEFAIAFSTTSFCFEEKTFLSQVSTACLNQLFQAVSDATEEAIWNSLTCATTTRGFRDRTLPAIPLSLDVFSINC